MTQQTGVSEPLVSGREGWLGRIWNYRRIPDPPGAEAAPELLVTLVGMRAEEQRFGREDTLGTFLPLGVTASPPLLTRTGTAPPTTGPRLQGTPNMPAEK